MAATPFHPQASALLYPGSGVERVSTGRPRQRGVERMLGEPASTRGSDAHVAVGVLAAARRYALGALALHARLDRQPERPRPELETLGRRLASTLDHLAGRLGQNGTSMPDQHLRETQLDVDDLAPDVAAETDMMVDSVNTMATLLAAPHASARRTA